MLRGVGTTNLNLGGADNLGLGGVAGGRSPPLPSPGGFRASGGMRHGGNAGRQSLQVPNTRTMPQSTFLNGFQGTPLELLAK